MYSFSYLEPVCCSMSSSNCCFLTCIQVSQEAGQVVWWSHLFQNFPQLIVIHTVKGFSVVNKAEAYVFLELSCFFGDPTDVGNLISGSSAFSKSSLNIWNFMVHILLKPGFEINPSWIIIGLPRWQSGKECACNARATGDSGSIPGSNRSPGDGNGYPLQYCICYSFVMLLLS